MTKRVGRLLAIPIVMPPVLLQTASATAGTTVPNVEAWLDRPLPSDAPPGSMVEIGAMLWVREGSVAITPSVFVRIHPAIGEAPPVDVPARQDWPGHFVAQVAIPAGGAGRLEIGTAGSACTASGCVRSDAMYAIAGAGPAPGAPLTTIATAEVVLPADQVVAGAPAEVEIVLIPRAAWRTDALSLPDGLYLQARRPRQPVLLEIAAHRVDPAALTYGATITLPEDGTFVLQVATSTDDSPTSLFGGSAVSLAVAPPPSAAPEIGSDPILAVAVLGLVAILLVAGLAVSIARRADR